MFKIGDKAKGFKFDGDEYPILGYDEEMDDVIGVVGEVSYIGDSSYSVYFKGLEIEWGYPRDLWYLGKVEEATVSDKVSFNAGEDVPFKVEDKVIPSFQIGDRVKFKKSSIDSGMIDATEDDVFNISHVAPSKKDVWIEEHLGWWSTEHLEHVKEETMNNTEEQEIKWEVGQEVWCILQGSGTVYDYTKEEYPVKVLFSSGEETSYTQCGRMRSWDKNRTLFFSEPKIEAEKFPPKKPFVPKLKKGDVIFVKVKDELYGEGTVRTVHGELNDRIYISEKHHYFLKKDILSIRVLSEEIIFN